MFHVSSRANARARLAAWDRYRRRWPDPRVSAGRKHGRWWIRAGRHRPGTRIR